MTAAGGLRDPVEAERRMGDALLSSGNARGACNHFHAALAVDPSNVASFLGLASAKLALNELVEAGDAVDQLARLAPTNPLTHEMRARLYIEKRAYPVAMDAAQEMIRLAPHDALGFHLLAVAYLGRKKYREALRATQEGLKVAPSYAGLWAQAALAKLELRGPYAASADMEEAFRLAPRDRYVRYVAAVVALACGQIRRARELCESLLRENPNDKSSIELYILTDGPFLLHRWVWRWTYFRRMAGPFSGAVRILGWVVFFLVAMVIGAGTAGGAWILMIGYRLWAVAEKKERARRMRRHFAAPTLNI